MNGLFEEQETAEVFAQLLRKAGEGAGIPHAKEQVDKSNPPELEAWAQYGLTYDDGIIGTDAAAWTERTAALSELESYRRTVIAEQGRAAGAADRGTVNNSVWMDTTTLTSSLNLILGRTDAIAPTSLIDLETFVRAVVLYDHIFYLPPIRELGLAALNERWKERVLLPLPVEEADIRPATGGITTPLGALLYAIYAQATIWMRKRGDPGSAQAELWDVTLDRWETVLGWRPQIDEMVRGFDSGITSDVTELIPWLLHLPHVFGREANLTARASARGAVFPYWLITESTARALFNWELARTLNLPYLGNVARIPFRQALIARQRAATRFLTSHPLDGVLDAGVRDQIRRLPTGATILPLPTFTAALVARVKQVGELPEALWDLRSETAGLRARRAELQARLDDKDTTTATIKQLQDAVTAEAKKLPVMQTAKFMGAAGAVWVSLAFSPVAPMAILGTVGLLLVIPEIKPIADRLMTRIRRPYEHVLNDLGSVARGSAAAIPRLQQLSYHPASGDWDQFANGLTRLGQLGVGC